MVSEKMGLSFYHRRPVPSSITLIFRKMFFFPIIHRGKLVWSILMKLSGFVYHVEDYCCANFRNQQSFLTCLKYNSKIAIFANHYIFI